MSYRVDVWGGDLHQNLVFEAEFEEWAEAAAFMGERMDEGSLCNVLHSDFISPEELTDAIIEKLLRGTKGDDA